MKKSFKVTPWEVSGDIDYDKLIKEFGIQKIDDKLLKRIKKYTKETHYMLKRKIVFAHRNVDWLLDQYEKNNKAGPYSNHQEHFCHKFFNTK